MPVYFPYNRSPDELARFRASLAEHNEKMERIRKRGYITPLPSAFRSGFPPSAQQPTEDDYRALSVHYDDMMTVFDEIRLSGRLRGWYLRRKYGLVNHFIF